MNERQATCQHRYDRPNWAGILGWRTDCGKCGGMFVPDEHFVGDGCEQHPSINGFWDVELRGATVEEGQSP